MTTVARVIDGDTFETGGGQRVRLAGVAVPEFGTIESMRATEKLRRLVDGQDVALRIRAVSFGQVVAEVKIGGRSVNKAMKLFLRKK